MLATEVLPSPYNNIKANGNHKEKGHLLSHVILLTDTNCCVCTVSTLYIVHLVPEEMGENRKKMRNGMREKRKRERRRRFVMVKVTVMSCVAVEGQCGCSVLTFNCTRQVGAAILSTLSDAVFTSPRQSTKSSSKLTLVRRLEEQLLFLTQKKLIFGNLQ